MTTKRIFFGSCLVLVIAILALAACAPQAVPCPCAQPGQVCTCAVDQATLVVPSPIVNVESSPIPTVVDVSTLAVPSPEVFSTLEPAPNGGALINLQDPELGKLKIITDTKVQQGRNYGPNGDRGMDARIAQLLLAMHETGWPVEVLGRISNDEPIPLFGVVSQDASMDQKNLIVQNLVATARHHGIPVILNIGHSQWFNGTAGSLIIGVEKEKFVGLVPDILPQGASPISLNKTRVQELQFGNQKVDDTLMVAPAPYLTGTASSGNTLELFRFAQNITNNHIIAVGLNSEGFQSTFEGVITQYQSDFGVVLTEMSVPDYEAQYNTQLIQPGTASDARLFVNANGEIKFTLGVQSAQRGLSINVPIGLVQGEINSGFLDQKEETNPLFLIQYQYVPVP